MTTTTLSSNKPSEKLFDRTLSSMIASCLRQNGILLAMYTVVLLLATVVLEAFYASSHDPSIPIPPRIGNLLSFSIVTYLLPVLLSSMLFHYLHNRLSVDFYHSMPVSRTKLFLSRYFTGLILLIAPIILSKILCTAIYLFFYTPHISAGHILLYNLSDLLFWIIMNIIVFNISCMVAVTCSNAHLFYRTEWIDQWYQPYLFQYLHPFIWSLFGPLYYYLGFSLWSHCTIYCF